LHSAEAFTVMSKPPNKACTGRLGLCAFFELVLYFGSFPFRKLVLPSRR
jgi:hypothetical protein